MEYFNHSDSGKQGWRWLEGTRVYMQVGTRELFEDEVKKTAEDMRAAGVEVRVREVSRSIHMFHMFHMLRMLYFCVAFRVPS
jgi:acetyl esterase/lipase